MPTPGPGWDLSKPILQWGSQSATVFVLPPIGLWILDVLRIDEEGESDRHNVEEEMVLETEKAGFGVSSYGI